ncbi:MAG: PKD domain-containing protein, partial [Methylococcus sp.]|nr:PKD domain-containing protein [Methylococcus sp.]
SGTANKPPVANAGPDQAVTIAQGQTSIAVTLNGSGSSDPDGSIAAYTWTGTPDPADTVNPSVTLNAGTYVFTLVVKDNKGAASPADTVTIVVNPAPAPNRAPTANAGPDQSVTLPSGQTGITVTLNGSGSSDPDGSIAAYRWTGNPDPADTVSPSVTLSAGTHVFTLVVTDNKGATSAADTVQITVNAAQTPSGGSINSTSTGSLARVTATVAEQPKVASTNYSLLAVNDLGMHCVDLDTRIVNILPPFQVMLGQVVQKGAKPVINPQGVELYYSAVSNPKDPILGRTDIFNGIATDGTTFKTNFWSAVNNEAYDLFYPPLDQAPLNLPAGTKLRDLVPADKGLPVPNAEKLYIGADGKVNSGDEQLAVAQHGMPGASSPYAANVPQRVEEHYTNKPMFVNFPFGYVADKVNWFEAAGIPMAPFDDVGRQNPFPLVRVQAKSGGSVLATNDIVLPVSSESACTNCHSDPSDLAGSRTSWPTDALRGAGLEVATSVQDPDTNNPAQVSVEYGADINILRLHDLRQGANYVDPTGAKTPCDIKAGLPGNSNGNANCLTYKAVVQHKPVVCQGCHYTPALDLAQVGPQAGAVGSPANGRNQVAHQSNSRVMHNHHGSFTNLFTAIPAPDQDPATGVVKNQAARLAALEQNCYQCHPGKETKCLRGAMFNGSMLCSDCHGDMKQIGADFSAGVSPTNPGAFVLNQGSFYDPASSQPRVPWANEPGCGSCHTGDANSNLANSANVIANKVDSKGNKDGIRLRQAFRSDDTKATPIVPANKRFAEPVIPAQFNGFNNPGAGNPKLYRVSTGHGGVMCEGCHGATHAEWPNATAAANDNLASTQLQGHTGAITECGTCHTAGSLSSSTQGGPHGMHLVNDSRFYADAHGDLAEMQNGQAGGGTCGSCHGSDHLGTVLSRAAADRSFSVEGKTVSVKAGQPVACNLCHSLSTSFEK